MSNDEKSLFFQNFCSVEPFWTHFIFIKWFSETSICRRNLQGLEKVQWKFATYRSNGGIMSKVFVFQASCSSFFMPWRKGHLGGFCPIIHGWFWRMNHQRSFTTTRSINQRNAKKISNLILYGHPPHHTK